MSDDNGTSGDNSTPDGSDDFLGLSDATLQAELHAYRESLEQEYARDIDDRAPENCEKYTREFFKKALPTAAAQIVWLAGNSTSDSVRLKASTIVVNMALEDAKADGDPIKDLLTQLQGNDKKKNTSKDSPKVVRNTVTDSPDFPDE